MARTNIVPSGINRAGTAPQAGVVGTVDGHMFDNDGRVFLRVTNAAGAARAVTFETPLTVGDLAVADVSVTLPASTVRYIGPFPIDSFNRGAGLTDAGKVYVNFPAGQEAQLTVEAYKL